MKASVYSLLLLATCVQVRAADPVIGREFALEGQQFQATCAAGKFLDCGELLFTGHPLHMAVGSLAPQNGFGAGVALTTHWTPNENWRLFGDADAVATPNGSWRAGVYVTAVRARRIGIVPRPGGESNPKHLISAADLKETFVLHAYSEVTSLNHINYYGLGQGTPRIAYGFGMTESVSGASVIWPVLSHVGLAITGEANARTYSLRPYHDKTVAALLNPAPAIFAPGAIAIPSYGQLGAGLRFAPSFGAGAVNLEYSAAINEWEATVGGYSFQRFTMDLDHEIPIYHHVSAQRPYAISPPDSCANDAASQDCPKVTLSRNVEGSVELRFVYTASFTGGTSVVPFYVDPTLGGADINGEKLLPSYADYRFRGPDAMVFRAAFEHSLGKLPIGFKFMVDEGRVGERPGDLGFSHLAHSYAAGLTLRAGGLPLVDLLFAWGGGEGTHTIATVNNSLLGGAPRPPL